MLDFNNETEQKELNYGPVPSGSKVLLTITVKTPQYAAHDHPLISETKTGFRQLWCQFTVIGGQYDGVSWHDNISLPTGYQTIRLNEKQTTAANIGGAQLRAIIEAHRGINPKATDQRSSAARRINDWSDLTGMEFPAKLGISKEPYVKDGVEYWNNRITSVITPDKEEYRLIKSGKEIITDGPVTGTAGTKKRNIAPESEMYGQPYPNSDNQSYGSGFPYDEPPF